MRLRGFFVLAFALAAFLDFSPSVQPAGAQQCLIPPPGVDGIRRTRFLNCAIPPGAGFAIDALRANDSTAGDVLTVQSDGSVLAETPTGGVGGGLTAVSSDSTLQGLGTAADLLGLTDTEVNRLDSVPGLLAETADLSIDVISQTWTDGIDLALGGFVSHGSGNTLTVAQAAALTYSITRAVTNADSLLLFVVVRVPDAIDLRDVRTRQRASGTDLYIDGWHEIGSAGGFTYAYSHHHLFSGYTAHFQSAATLTTTHFRGESDAENVTVDASGFTGNLLLTDIDVLTALRTIDALIIAGGVDNFVGARAGISPARTGQDYTTLTTLTWDTEEFDVGGFFDPASDSRMTVPSGVPYAVVHGGVTLGGFASTGDLFIDILKNGVSLGIGSTTKNIGIGTVARTSVTTGVVEVSEGDYFEIAISVIQDTSVSLQPIGTFFSTHAASTEIGGSSPDTNDYVDHIGLGLSGQDLTLTLGRTGSLSSISGSITLPSGGGGGTTVSPVAYSAPLEDIAATAYGTATQILNLGTEEFNLGSFTVDDTGTTDRIVIPEDGLYELILSLHAVGDNRTVITGQFTVDNGTDPEAAIAGQGSGYVRGLSTENFIIAEHAHFAQLSAGDMIGVTLVSSATSVNLSIVGASSSIEVIKIGGTQGAAGQGVAAGGTVGQVLGKASAADYDTAWVDQTGGGTGFLPLTGGTLTGRLTMDITGNNEGLVINHSGGTSESAAHFFTNTTGVQKAVQASRSNQSTALVLHRGPARR